MTRFTQPQREALIELLCLAIVVDHHISSAEQVAMHHALKKLGWEGEVPREMYLIKALQEARDLADDENCIVPFLASRTALFESQDEHDLAMKFLMLVLEIDGMSEEKDTFLARVEAAFNE